MTKKQSSHVVVFNRREWLSMPIFGWTELEIDSADERGFIGTKHGADCYLSRHIEAVASSD